MKFYLVLLLPIGLLAINWYSYRTLGFEFKPLLNLICLNTLIAYLVGIFVGELE
jgi:hypothetical protein